MLSEMADEAKRKDDALTQHRALHNKNKGAK